jgi:hypothetical protein
MNLLLYTIYAPPSAPSTGHSSSSSSSSSTCLVVIGRAASICSFTAPATHQPPAHQLAGTKICFACGRLVYLQRIAAPSRDHHTSWQLALHCHIDAPPLPTNSLSGGPEYMADGGSEWAVASPSYALGGRNVPQRQSAVWAVGPFSDRRVLARKRAELRKVANSTDRGWR